ncbi:MAG: alternative ribosome rescue aminoacyl-tRNA hydrolase ArfB [Deltaproteobacteria bacterium]
MSLKQSDKGGGMAEKTAEEVVINNRLAIPLAELHFFYARSSGPGGQHVNKVNTKATLLFNVSTSPSLTEKDRIKIFTHLATRINKKGILRVASLKFRSQAANRHAAQGRFVELLSEALQERRKRRATRPSRAAKERRIANKKHRAMIKKARGHGGLDQE